MAPAELRLDACLRAFAVALVLGVAAGHAQSPSAKPSPKPVPKPAPAPTTPDPLVERFLGVFAATDGLEFEVSSDGATRTLVVRPRSASAAHRLATGTPPDAATAEVLAAAEARVRAGLEPMAKQRGEPDAGAFVDRAAMAAAEKSVAAAVARTGGVRDFAVVRVDASARRAFVVCRGQKGEVAFEVQWSGSGRLATVVEAKEPFAGATFAVVRADWAELQGKQEARPAQAATLSVEGRFAGRVLVLEDRSGLLELGWVRDLR